MPYLLAWIPVGALFTALTSLAPEIPWTGTALVWVPMVELYAFLSLSPWQLCRVFPLSATPWSRLAAFGIAAPAVTAAAWLMVGAAWASLLSRTVSPQADEYYFAAVPLSFVLGFVLYALSIVGHYLLISYEETRRAERKALESRLLAREIELKVFKAQLDPHFLFNSLNSISSLIGSDTEGARRMCLLLAEFLRTSLGLANRSRIPLSEEIALIERFLKIERVRFGPRLRLSLDIDQRTEACLIPPLLLQPLVENAVKHGIAHLLDGGMVQIRSWLAGDDLKLLVWNESDPDRGSSSSAGVGLDNVRNRIAATFGDAARMDVIEESARFAVELRLPAHRAGSAEAIETGADTVPHLMEISIDIDDSVPLFAQLIGQIKEAVLCDKISPGDALPSIRQLANDLELNNKTVAKAYRLLERDSVIQTKGYRGTFVHPDAKVNSTVR